LPDNTTLVQYSLCKSNWQNFPFTIWLFTK